MPITLTPTEIAQLQADKAKAESASATFQAQVAAQQAEAAKLAISDGAMKKFFDQYNDNIIGKYDLEQKAINGTYVTNPIVEADIIACASLANGRIQPSLPATDVVRISQFDGTPTAIDTNNELQYISDQAQVETALVSGYGGTAPAASVLTSSTITASSTTLQLTDLTTTFSIAPNTVLVVSTMSDLAVIKILTFNMQVSPVPPPYVADCTIEVIVPPSGTIPTGTQLTTFNGFTNGERTTKTTTNPQMQPLMNYLVLQLQTTINSRISSLNAQLSPIATNEDPDGIAQLNQATTDVNASISYLTTYLISTDISDTGLSSLSAERISRTTQANTRVSQIISAYTNQTLNYYNERYNYANNRANTSRGTLRLQKAAEQTASTSQSYATTLQDQATALGSILP